jgi:hypothetical protein
MDQRISEIIPGLSDLSLSTSALSGARETAREIRMQRQRQEQQQAAELLELDDIYDFSKRNPVDTQLPQGTWTQKVKPAAKKIVLSPYQYEMINYQRMLMRKNIWYYRCVCYCSCCFCCIHSSRRCVGTWKVHLTDCG